jgi:hypothetical protein
MHMFRWFFYYIWITWHGIVTFGPLKGILVCLWRTWTGESLIMKAQGHLDLHLGMNPTGWMMCPLIFGHMEDECFLWRHERTP